MTLPLRRRTPDFLIVGFAKAGTTSMANHLHRHPAISGIDGLTWHEALSKESHFFSGALGRHSGASSAAIYRSYFPTVLQRWWVERVKRAGKVRGAVVCTARAAARTERTPAALALLVATSP